ncbi:MAG: (deoxy)nucleoside triphosphate pyrophosphohydrolase [Bacteroidales bacterium]|nr:(deoxy)nucleoside triphosphate pyrophosphohydrolase [Bacteroidales bacterium]MDD2322491.1 (deoxy)nucleoside triphosphate pyrophosphohydrolase [Bacteroidales bacterium]MDD3010377.1 (deoxy)nucleoside triphosphate pyrophosphohydrolase [Bacteroidales bacterium]MDD3962007.1 (deoxy)nucleoside triphosphate pyrophosphohydrolase [Bacteroidales bacterium]
MKILTVTAGVLHKEGKVLLAQRRNDSTPRSGKWEFPGGKLETGETMQQGLRRELHEELSIDAKTGRFITEHIHHYPDTTIRLMAFHIEEFEGDIVLHSHQKMEWVALGDLAKYDLSDADKPIARRLQKNPEEILPEKKILD